ncbi:MAG: threonylcarbamoyl-AMP synthase [Acidimicrobiia bacterium]|nr:threonylcarbamoyl-AMP synthase [Acidimicrobiia bacterium]
MNEIVGVARQPVARPPVAWELGSREPAVRQPAVREPPVARDIGSREPAVREPPVARDIGSQEPAVRQPAVRLPVAREPASACQPGDLDLVVDALLDGQVVLLPTDTVYGLVVSASNADALNTLFSLKHRPLDTSVAVLVADAMQASRYVDLGMRGSTLAKCFWPGALTIVAERIDDGAIVAGTSTTLGVRCPDDEFVCNVASRVGPLAASSANLHGQPTPNNCAAAAAMFPSVQVVVDGGPRRGSASTVVSVVNDELKLLRRGPVLLADIEAVVR